MYERPRHNLVTGTYRAVLALHAGAVEAQGGDPVADPLDVEDALVAPLTRLGLGKVLGLQGDGLHLPRRDQNLPGAHQLGTVLETGSQTADRHMKPSGAIEMQEMEEASGEVRRKWPRGNGCGVKKMKYKPLGEATTRREERARAQTPRRKENDSIEHNGWFGGRVGWEEKKGGVMKNVGHLHPSDVGHFEMENPLLDMMRRLRAAAEGATERNRHSSVFLDGGQTEAERAVHRTLAEELETMSSPWSCNQNASRSPRRTGVPAAHRGVRTEEGVWGWRQVAGGPQMADRTTSATSPPISLSSFLVSYSSMHTILPLYSLRPKQIHSDSEVREWFNPVINMHAEQRGEGLKCCGRFPVEVASLLSNSGEQREGITSTVPDHSELSAPPNWCKGPRRGKENQHNEPKLPLCLSLYVVSLLSPPSVSFSLSSRDSQTAASVQPN
ncbi:hypothetical protein EYF80_037520 [Liparis tanakae]|uniref:Uncharacterized protein n=1 Tax=Liparis tanakae TaxID=230148 RepID=A0A4Z2GHB4_9TELE|nr:hypothetical protein EYF80_037520 [Liparis tanakae]